MTIEITKNEAMWIASKVAASCAKGNSLIADVTDDELKDESLKKLVSETREIVNKLADLGLKIIAAIEKEEMAGV